VSLILYTVVFYVYTQKVCFLNRWSSLWFLHLSIEPFNLCAIRVNYWHVTRLTRLPRLPRDRQTAIINGSQTEQLAAHPLLYSLTQQRRRRATCFCRVAARQACYTDTLVQLSVYWWVDTDTLSRLYSIALYRPMNHTTYRLYLAIIELYVITTLFSLCSAFAQQDFFYSAASDLYEDNKYPSIKNYNHIVSICPNS